METTLPLDEVLGRLPWYGDLTPEHRDAMLADVRERLASQTTHDEFTVVLRGWSDVAHRDGKWARLEMLRASGILRPVER